MNRSIKLLSTAAALTLGLAGCRTVGPNYQRPAVTVPSVLNTGLSAASALMLRRFFLS